MARTEAVYLAGFFDGEGSIGVYRQNGKTPTAPKRVRLCVNVGGTNEESIRRFQRRYGGYVYARKRAAAHPRWHDAWSWVVWDAPARAVLVDLLPFLAVKREQALLAIQMPLVGRGYRRTPEQSALAETLVARLRKRIA